MMKARGLSVEAAGPSSAPPPAPARSEVPVTLRLLAGLGGAFLLTICLLAAHLALLGVVGVGITWLVQRLRRRPYTRSVGWVGSVVATGVVFLATFIIHTSSVRGSSFDALMTQAAQQQKQQSRKQSTFLRQLVPGLQPNPASDSLSQRLVQSRTFVVLTLGVMGLMAAGMAGVLLGTLGWAMATTVLFALFARWTFGAPPAAPPA